MASNRIYVGHLSYRARESDLEDFFGRYGRVREILLKNGFGFVEFDDPRDAEEAVYRANGKDLRGDRIIVEMTKRPPRGRGGGDAYYRGMGNRYPPNSRSPTRNPAFPYSQTKYKLRVKNLSSRVSWQDLKDTFRSIGEVMYADAHREKMNEGLVCFSTYSDMKRAKEQMDGKDMNGRCIELYEVIDDGRGRSRSRSGGGKRSLSRSRSRSKSRSLSRSKSRSLSRSGSPQKVPKKRSLSRSLSRSRSGSPGNAAVNGT